MRMGEAKKEKKTKIISIYNVQVYNFVFSFTNSTLNSFIHQTNVFYGALDPEVTNVFFTNGEIDPWHRMGILKNLNSKSPAAFIPGTCALKIYYFTDELKIVKSSLND